MAPQQDKISAMLRSDDPELQCAAARVLGELKPKDTATIRALGQILADSRESVRLYVLSALKNIGSKSALQYIIPRLSTEDPERRTAAAAITAIGDAALPELKKQMPKLSPAGKLAAADIIISIGSEQSFDILLEALTMGDFDLGRHVCDLFRDKLPGFSKTRKDLLFRKVTKFISAKQVKENEVATIAALRLLGYIGHDESLDRLVPYLSEEETPAVRRHALLAISALLPVRKPKPDFVKALLHLLNDRAHPDIVETSLRILNGLTIPATLSDDMVKLLYSRHSAIRKLAVRALEHFGTLKSTRALLECLNRADWELTPETMAALRRLKHTPEIILSEVEKTDDKERARRLANVLRGGKFGVPASLLNNLAGKLLQAIAEDGDKLDIYFALMSSLSEEHLMRTLLSRAEDLKKAEKYQEAERHLRMLTQLGPPTPELKYQLAVVRLKLNGKSMSAVDRAADPALALLAPLAAQPGFDLLKRLQREKDVLAPEDYFYVAYHFSASEGAEKQFGIDLMQFVSTAFPRSEEAKKAKQRLKKSK